MCGAEKGAQLTQCYVAEAGCVQTQQCEPSENASKVTTQSNAVESYVMSVHHIRSLLPQNRAALSYYFKETSMPFYIHFINH